MCFFDNTSFGGGIEKFGVDKIEIMALRRHRMIEAQVG